MNIGILPEELLVNIFELCLCQHYCEAFHSQSSKLKLKKNFIKDNLVSGRYVCTIVVMVMIIAMIIIMIIVKDIIMVITLINIFKSCLFH